MVCASNSAMKQMQRSRSQVPGGLCCRGMHVIRNAIAIPQPNDPTKLFHCQYDAWNRLIEVCDESGKRAAAYDYDALGRRVLKRRYQNGQLAETRFFYYSHDWRLLEEWHQTSSQPMPKAAVQYAWGLRGPDDLGRDNGDGRLYFGALFRRGCGSGSFGWVVSVVARLG
jgi:YD repeat-containing protein